MFFCSGEGLDSVFFGGKTRKTLTQMADGGILLQTQINAPRICVRYRWLFFINESLRIFTRKISRESAENQMGIKWESTGNQQEATEGQNAKDRRKTDFL